MLQGILQEALEHGQFWRLRDSAGKPPGVIGWWPARAVTFIDNHDTGMSGSKCTSIWMLYSRKHGFPPAFTCIPSGGPWYEHANGAGPMDRWVWLGTGSTQGHWPFPVDHLVQGYVYILTHPGTPCIFYDHLFTDGLRRASSVWGSLKRLLSSAGSLKVWAD
jgi:alpha-amylase